MYLASVAVAGALAFGLYQVLKPTPGAEADRILTSSREAAEQDDIASALDGLEFILTNYADTPAAGEAARLHHDLQDEQKLLRYQQQYRQGALSASETRKLVGNLRDELQSADLKRRAERFLDALPPEAITLEDDVAATGQDEAEAAARAWTEAKPLIEGMIARNETATARKALEMHLERYTGTPGADEARRMLDDIFRAERQAFDRAFNEATRARADGRTPEAWNALEKLCFSAGPGQRQEVHAELVRITRDCREIFGRLRALSFKAFARIDPDVVRQAAKDPEAALNGLAWQDNIANIRDEARLVRLYGSALRRSLSAKAGFRASIPGIEGRSQLVLDGADALKARAPKRPELIDIGWEQLREDTLWELAPRAELEDRKSVV